jgi:hypothetical protein
MRPSLAPGTVCSSVPELFRCSDAALDAGETAERNRIEFIATCRIHVSTAKASRRARGWLLEVTKPGPYRLTDRELVPCLRRSKPWERIGEGEDVKKRIVATHGAMPKAIRQSGALPPLEWLGRPLPISSGRDPSGVAQPSTSEPARPGDSRCGQFFQPGPWASGSRAGQSSDGRM